MFINSCFGEKYKSKIYIKYLSFSGNSQVTITYLVCLGVLTIPDITESLGNTEKKDRCGFPLPRETVLL